MLWLSNDTKQDLKLLPSFSCGKIDEIVPSYSKTTNEEVIEVIMTMTIMNKD
jgi:hypothetical protein